MSHALCLPALILVFALASGVQHAVSRTVNHYHLALFAQVDTKSCFHC